jgi:hypothetical protein
MSCSQLYLGANRPLEEVATPEFSVEREVMGGPDYSSLKSVLGVPNIYYLAPHAGCGCGWEYLDVGTAWDNRNLDSVERLKAYLRQAVTGGELLVLSTCIDTLGRKPDSRQRFVIDQFLVDLLRWRVRFGTARAVLAEVVA